MFLVLCAGCFEPRKPACAFLCGDDSACPEGYVCGGDERCHLVTPTGLAACEDTLPPDGMPPDTTSADGMPDGTPDGSVDASFDASSPDAQIDATPGPDAQIDAAPPPPDAQIDAAPQNQAPTLILTPPTTSYTVVAGASLTIVASGTDPELDPLTFDATFAGTGLDPFAVGPHGATDHAGGVWTSATDTFTFEAGKVGTFTVRFSVTDGPNPVTRDVTIVVTAHPIRLNEVEVVPDEIELLNTGGSMVNVSGWNLISGGASFQIPNGTMIAAGDFLVVHWNQTGSDGPGERFTGAKAPLGDTGQVALYADDNFDVSRRMRDFVMWATTASGREAEAVFAGQWTTTSALVGAVADGESAARTPGANTEAPADWYVETTPTIGAANVP